METSQAVIITTEKNSYSFTFILPVGSTWSDAVAASAEIYTQICEMAKQAVPQEQAESSATMSDEVIEPTIIEGE